ELAHYARVPVAFTPTAPARLKGRLGSAVTLWTAPAPGIPTFPPSITETLFEPLFAMYAKGAPIAAGAPISESTSKLRRIPEVRLVPENPLGSGHLVFIASCQCSGSAIRESRM